MNDKFLQDAKDKIASMEVIEVTSAQKDYSTDVIIKATEECLAKAYVDNDNFHELELYHNTWDIAQMNPWDICALLRSSSRVKAFYPRWYDMRDAAYKRLQQLQAEGYAVRGEVINPDHLMRGMLKSQPTDPKPVRKSALGIPYFGMGM